MEKIEEVPINPEYVKYLKQPKEVNVLFNEYGMGDVPDLIDFSYYKIPAPKKVSALSLPSSFDLRDIGGVSPVKNQRTFGTCWAFAATSSLEGYLKRLYSDSRTFSEKHLVDYNGWERDETTGGNVFSSSAYLFGWRGPINEFEDPYPTDSNWGEKLDPPWVRQIHPINMKIIPQRGSALDNDLIKNSVYNYGPVYYRMAWDSTYYNNTHKAYYYPNTERVGGHAVSLIGWDDNYPSNRFNHTPPGNGAFLIKNSWGTSWGDQGYFWISYYDGYAGREVPSYEYETYLNTPFDFVYQHDLNGWVTQFGFNSTSDVFAGKIFQVEQNSFPLKAINVVTTQSNQEIEVFIYLNPTNGDPASGKLIYQEEKQFVYAGYHTIILPYCIDLNNINQFSVVIKYIFEEHDKRHMIPIERSSDAVIMSPIFPNQSFSKLGTSPWRDLYDYYDPPRHVCIKALCQKYPTRKRSIINDEEMMPIVFDGIKSPVIENNI